MPGQNLPDPVIRTESTLTGMSARAVLCSALMLLSVPAQAETPAQWIELGARVHGAFGAFIPIGIRIGLDAKGASILHRREGALSLHRRWGNAGNQRESG
jgi:hypothetical protein